MPSLAAMLHTTGIATPLSYVGRVGLDRFYNLRSPRTRVVEISSCRELLRRLCIFADGGPRVRRAESMTLSPRRDIVAALDDFRQLYRNPAIRARASTREISRRSRAGPPLVRRDRPRHARDSLPRELANSRISRDRDRNNSLNGRELGGRSFEPCFERSSSCSGIREALVIKRGTG